MWSYCALIAGHDGIDSPICRVCPSAQHKAILPHVSQERDQRNPSGIGKRAAANRKGVGFASFVRSTVRCRPRFIS